MIKKGLKRKLAAILAAVVCFTAIPAMDVSAVTLPTEGVVTYSVSETENLVTGEFSGSEMWYSFTTPSTYYAYTYYIKNIDVPGDMAGRSLDVTVYDEDGAPIWNLYSKMYGGLSAGNETSGYFGNRLFKASKTYYIKFTTEGSKAGRFKFGFQCEQDDPEYLNLNPTKISLNTMIQRTWFVNDEQDAFTFTTPAKSGRIKLYFKNIDGGSYGVFFNVYDANQEGVCLVGGSYDSTLGYGKEYTKILDLKPNKKYYIITKSSSSGSYKFSLTALAGFSKVKLSKTSVAYTGKAIKPSVTVTDTNGKVVSSSNYTVSYSSNTNVGVATVKIIGKNSFAGCELKTTFKITVPTATVSSAKSAKKKQLTVAVKKNTKVNGYQIQVSTDKNFKKNVKTITLNKNTKTSYTFSKLSSGKKYYIRVRSYKTVNGSKKCSSWTLYSKTVKVK